MKSFKVSWEYGKVDVNNRVYLSGKFEDIVWNSTLWNSRNIDSVTGFSIQKDFDDIGSTFFSWVILIVEEIISLLTSPPE